MINLGIKNKVAVITGANYGIGKEIALSLAKQGVIILIHYLGDPSFSPEEEVHFEGSAIKENANKRLQEANSLKKQINQAGGIAEIFEADLSDSQSPEKIIRFAEENLGPVSILINNAAHCELPDTILTTQALTIERHFTVNTKAAILLISAFAKRFIAKGQKQGRIINISTDSAQIFPSQISYGASKAAMEAYTRSLAVELGTYGITVNTIAPGPIQTGWISEDLAEKIIPDIPVKRLGYPKDIADFTLFLASEQASFVTGQVIKVSGGHAL